ncbi:phospholipid scramblase-related protein [Vulgatibacter sp.]|uniref:phospholipid scramblase-related protein n=1 Tax=Vulgatibacter sp. TaxID=1971226 RepID=UPI0035637A80
MHTAHSSSTTLPALSGVTQLRVRQKRELAEVFTGWETRNRYEIEDETGAPILYAGETGGGVGAFFLRQWFGGKRPFTIEVKDRGGATVLTVKRPWRWFFARAEIHDAQGRLLGAIQQKWAIFSRKYVIEGPTGAVGAELFGPFFKPWTFELKVHGRVVGKIAKRWSGMLKEAFTDADNFGLELAPSVDDRLRPLCLGATFLIDFVHFEKND